MALMWLKSGVAVIRSPEANAFVMPNGRIVVYTGILPITPIGDNTCMARTRALPAPVKLAAHGGSWRSDR